MEPTTPSTVPGPAGPRAPLAPARSGPLAHPLANLGASWPDQLADGVESAVGLVRDKAVRPATTLAKALVYGPVVALVGLTALVLVGMAVVRGLNSIPGFQDWISLAALGGLFTLIGLFLLGRGRSALKAPK